MYKSKTHPVLLFNIIAYMVISVTNEISNELIIRLKIYLFLLNDIEKCVQICFFYTAASLKGFNVIFICFFFRVAYFQGSDVTCV